MVFINLLSANHVLFQLANLSLLTSFALTDLLLLRLALAIACTFFSIWGAFVLNLSVDTFTWNAVFAVINLFRAGQLIHQERPIKLHPMEEELYMRVFLAKNVPLGRRDFKKLASKAVILDYDDGETYLQHGHVPETVALIMSGQVDVFGDFGQNECAKINVTGPWEWADSPQFIFNNSPGIPAAQPATVSLVASGPTQLCVWTFDDLRLLCAANPQLAVCLNSVISQDCAVKIINTELYLFSSEAIRTAAANVLSDADRVRRASSLTKIHVTPKQRIYGPDDTVIDFQPSATSTPAISRKASRKLGAPASPPPTRASKTKPRSGSITLATLPSRANDDVSTSTDPSMRRHTTSYEVQMDIVSRSSSKESVRAGSKSTKSTKPSKASRTSTASTSKAKRPATSSSSLSSSTDLDSSSSEAEDDYSTQFATAIAKPTTKETTYPRRAKKDRREVVEPESKQSIESLPSEERAVGADPDDSEANNEESARKKKKRTKKKSSVVEPDEEL